MVLELASKSAALVASNRCQQISGQSAQIVKGYRKRGQWSTWLVVHSGLTERETEQIVDSTPLPHLVAYSGCLSKQARAEVSN